MKKTSTILLLSFLLSLGLFSCGKETQSTTQGGGTFICKVSISPPLQAGSVSSGQYNTIQIWGGGFLSKWDGSANSVSLSELSSDPISVTSGQNVTCYLFVANSYDLACRTITIDGIQNGKTIKSYTLSMGSSGATMPCTDGIQNQKTFIIQ